ncbi:MAG: presqualene diphosphate synthase HpnD [Mariprofundaceae bacterium]
MSQSNNDTRYCIDKVRGSGSSFFYSFLLLPEDQRRAMMALYSFCREIDDIADEVPDQQVATVKMQFWRDEIGRVFAGKPRHPVGKELAWALQQYALDEKVFHEVINGMIMDIARIPMVKSSDLELYCYRVAGAVGLLSVEIFGYSNARSRDFATSLGDALQLTNILRDLKEDAERGRIYIPQEERIRFGVADQDFIDGNFNDAMSGLLTHFGDKAEGLYQQALQLLPNEDRVSLRPSMIMGSIYYAYLQRLRQAQFNAWGQPIHLLPARKMWIAWRVWRREKRDSRRGVAPSFT